MLYYSQGLPPDSFDNAVDVGGQMRSIGPNGLGEPGWRRCFGERHREPSLLFIGTILRPQPS